MSAIAISTPQVVNENEHLVSVGIVANPDRFNRLEFLARSDRLLTATYSSTKVFFNLAFPIV
jgi:hypothetical protein